MLVQSPAGSYTLTNGRNKFRFLALRIEGLALPLSRWYQDKWICITGILPRKRRDMLVTDTIVESYIKIPDEQTRNVISKF